MRHVLSFIHGGVAIVCHNEVRDKLLYLVQQALYPNYEIDELLIHHGHSRSEEELHQGKGVLDTRVDILIREFW